MKYVLKFWLACIVWLACIAGGAITSFPSSAYAAEDESRLAAFMRGIEFSGFVDTYYSYRYSRPDKVETGSENQFLNLRAWDRRHNSFALSNIQLSVFKPSTEESPIGFGFVTHFGDIANQVMNPDTNEFGDEISDKFAIQQGFVTYKAPIGNGLDFKVGRFATWIGSELIETVDNPNYSRGLLFTNAIPYTHTGIAISYPLLDTLTTSAFFVNSWDGQDQDNNSAKSFGYQFHWAFGQNTDVVFNGIHGAEREDSSKDLRHLWDIVVAHRVMEGTKLILNGIFGTEAGGGATGGVGKWWGFSGILSQDITDAFGLALRGEYFDDGDGAMTGVATGAGIEDSLGALVGTREKGLRVWGATLTANIKIRENLLVRPEVRYDEANQGAFRGHRSDLSTAMSFAYLF
ncbi:MAG: outer membrane beta-barrel protein [Candidatus Loosdrechtia sp.]|uniref:outer membrane beta-barrel protein n=1 Tax=Candidatus Loosdrechtia sp. TaxID=3101272 RepID=UPI003A6E4816|nr:MAG: outer membrane beta-barrel protein [Candidatus Jettenia sp. AMX2]